MQRESPESMFVRPACLRTGAITIVVWWMTIGGFAAGFWAGEPGAAAVNGKLDAVADSTETLSAPWTSIDVGAVGRAGSASVAGGVFSISGAGADIWGSTDSFHFVSQPVTGDGAVVARVTSLQNTHQYAKAGVMLRASSTASAAHVILDVKPGGGLEFMTRSVAGGTTTFLAGAGEAAPVWLRLERSGSLVIASWSSNGVSWSEAGRTATSLPSTVYAGLAVVSHDTSVLMTATFDNVGVSSGTVNPDEPPAAPAGPLPPDGAVDVLTTIALNWSSSAGATRYDVRLGTSSPPPLVSTDQTATSYQPPAALASGTKYFWQVTARGPGGTTPGPVWSFTTRAAPDPAPSPPPSTALRRLRVLTWNVNGGRDRQGIANVDAQVSLLARSGAHVIVLQEVTIEGGTDLPALFESKLEAATGRAWFAVWAEEPRSAPAVPQGNLVLSMLPVGATGTVELDAAPSAPSNLDAKRSAGRITVTVNGVPVTIATTALANDATSRQLQIDQLQAWMATTDGRRLIGASLGMRPGEPGYADLAGTFADVWSALVTTSDTGVTAEAFGTPPAPARVDGWWQELPGGSAVAVATEIWIVKTARSDHHAVVAEVDVR